jgi:hypothetical protein
MSPFFGLRVQWASIAIIRDEHYFNFCMIRTIRRFFDGQVVGRDKVDSLSVNRPFQFMLLGKSPR